MEGPIQINFNQHAITAQSLSQNVSNLTMEASAIYNAVSALSGQWTGKSSDAFVEASNALLLMTFDIIDNLQTLSSKIEMAGREMHGMDKNLSQVHNGNATVK